MKIENFGPISELTFEYKKINIICGENNTGKTFLSYFLYAYRKFLSEGNHFTLTQKQKETFVENMSIELEFNDVIDSVLNKIIKYLENDFKLYLGSFFKLEESIFKDMKISTSKEEISNTLFFMCQDIFEKHEFDENNTLTFDINNGKFFIKTNCSTETLKEYSSKKKEAMFIEMFERASDLLLLREKNYYFPAERIGLNLFKDQLDSSDIRLAGLIKAASQYSSNDYTNRSKVFNKTLDLITEAKPDFARPIADYLDFLRNVDYSSKYSTTNQLEYLRKEILNGKLSMDEGKIYFHKRLGEKRYQKNNIPFHVTSSSIKSIFGFDAYLLSFANENDNLFIDEPEINLHPLNQIKFCNLISLMVKRNESVTIATHSDYIIRKFTNLVLDGTFEENDLSCILLSSKKNICTSVLDNKFIANFDDPMVLLEKEYYELVD